MILKMIWLADPVGLRDKSEIIWFTISFSPGLNQSFLSFWICFLSADIYASESFGVYIFPSDIWKKMKNMTVFQSDVEMFCKKCSPKIINASLIQNYHLMILQLICSYISILYLNIILFDTYYVILYNHIFHYGVIKEEVCQTKMDWC